MYVTLNEAKTHLYIDSTFTLDDSYINSLIAVSETAIENHIDTKISGFTTFPTPIKHAILLLIGNLYANREPVSFANPVHIPYTLDYLLAPYKYYGELPPVDGGGAI